MNTTSAPATAESKKKDLYTIDGVLATDIEVRSAKTAEGPKPYAYGKITGKNGKTHTIMTFVKKAIDFLNGKKAGDAVRIYGTFEQQDKGRTFSAMDQSIPRPKAEAAPVAESTPEVAPEESAPATDAPVAELAEV